MTTTTTPTDITTHEALIKDLTNIVKTSNADEDKLNKAKEKQAQAADQSIRALAARVSQINETLAPEVVSAIAESVADAIANSNANVKKARKSEIKLCLDQRHNISGVIREIDKVASRRDDNEKKINLRAATLGALRVAKKEGKDCVDAVHGYLDKYDYVKSDSEKLQTHIDAIAAASLMAVAVDGDTRLHPGVDVLLRALAAAADGDFSKVESFAPPEDLATEETKLADVILESLGVPENPSFNDDYAAAAAEDADTPRIVIKKPVEEDDCSVDKDFDEDADFDSVISGLL